MHNDTNPFINFAAATVTTFIVHGSVVALFAVQLAAYSA